MELFVAYPSEPTFGVLRGFGPFFVLTAPFSTTRTSMDDVSTVLVELFLTLNSLPLMLLKPSSLVEDEVYGGSLDR